MIPIRKRLARVMVPGCLGTMLFLLLLGQCGLAQGDQVILYDGKVIEGKIISESDTRVTIDVDTIRITLMRKEIKEIKKGDQLFGVIEQQAQPDKPTTDSAVLPALRQTAAAEVTKAVTPPPTNTPVPKVTDTETNTVAPKASDTPTVPAKVAETSTPTFTPVAKASNTPTFTAVTQATHTPTFTVKAQASNTPTFTAIPQKPTEAPTKKPAPQPTNTPVPKPTKAVAPAPTVKPTEKPVEQPVAPTPEAVTIPLSKVETGKIPKGDAYIVARDFINVRNGPSPKDEPLGKLYKNTILIVDAKADTGYLHFKALESSDQGWAHGNLLTKIPDTPVLVTARKVNFRKGPGTTHIRIGELQEGDVGRILERQGNWIRIRTLDNKVGWVSANYVTVVGQ